MDIAAAALKDLLDQAELDNLRRMQRAFLHYEGTVEKPFVPAGEVDDSIRPMRAATIVDKGASFLFGGQGGIQLQTDDAKAAGKIGEVWPEMQRSAQLTDLAVNGGVTGHAFARLMQDGRVIVLDPATVIPETDPDDYESVIAWKVQWATEVDNVVKVRRLRFDPADSGETWDIVQEEYRSNRWTITDENTWPYAWSPILHGKNLPAPNRFWGTADLEAHVLDLIEDQWSLLAYMRRLVRFSGHPARWAAGEDLDDEDKPIDVSQDQLLKLKGRDVRVGQFDAAGDLGAAVELYREVRDELREITHMPPVAHGKLESAGQLSGFALQILYGPLVDRTETKHQSYGPLVCEIASRKLELAGHGEGVEITPVWHDAVPDDPQTEALSAESDRRMGLVSRQTLRERRGYDHDTEIARLDEERELEPDELAQLFNGGRVAT